MLIKKMQALTLQINHTRLSHFLKTSFTFFLSWASNSIQRHLAGGNNFLSLPMRLTAGSDAVFR